jgi:hypothetical protein
MAYFEICIEIEHLFFPLKTLNTPWQIMFGAFINWKTLPQSLINLTFYLLNK